MMSKTVMLVHGAWLTPAGLGESPTTRYNGQPGMHEKTHEPT